MHDTRHKTDLPRHEINTALYAILCYIMAIAVGNVKESKCGIHCLTVLNVYQIDYMVRAINEKSAQRRRKHCALAVGRRSQKFSPRPRPPSRGRGTAKI